MKTPIFIVLMIGLSLSANAQTWNEWFRQKKTQKKYLVQQIAALKVYLKYLKEGYDIAKKGLDLVGDIKDGNLNDHSTYFGSLRSVNDVISNDSKIDLIVTYHKGIINEFHELEKECRANAILSEAEVKYIGSVYKNILKESESSLAALTAIIVNEGSQMTDDERIDRISKIYEDTKDMYGFTRSFCNSTKMLAMQRTIERNEIKSQRMLNPAL